jgi:SAM-dependent methyltransferase
VATIVRGKRRVVSYPIWRDPPLPIPAGQSLKSSRDLISSVRVGDGSEAELAGYWTEAFGRFLRTLDLAGDLKGRSLELGANPYFLTVLLTEFTELDQTLANYFGDPDAVTIDQDVRYRAPNGEARTATFTSRLFDAEAEAFPFDDASFDVVFFCEILEHMTNDPVAVLREINRVLTTEGHLILTTPNIGRLENVARLILGLNVYDPYSGYGPHGRHNREYNPHELTQLLSYTGFAVDVLFTADSHEPDRHLATVASATGGISRERARDLGQYIFCRARRRDAGGTKLPTFLYRSYPDDELEDVE